MCKIVKKKKKDSEVKFSNLEISIPFLFFFFFFVNLGKIYFTELFSNCAYFFCFVKDKHPTQLLACSIRKSNLIYDLRKAHVDENIKFLRCHKSDERF